MDPPGHRAPLSPDTALASEQVQTTRWREMSPREKGALVTALCLTTRALSLAGIRRRHPEASPRECFLRLASLTLGRDLARRAYPELADLSDLP